MSSLISAALCFFLFGLLFIKINPNNDFAYPRYKSWWQALQSIVAMILCLILLPMGVMMEIGGYEFAHGEISGPSAVLLAFITAFFIVLGNCFGTWLSEPKR